MVVNSIGNTNYYAPKRNPGVSQLTPEQQKIFDRIKTNPRKNMIFIDPKTGKRTTWKPGIYNPEQQNPEKAAKTATKVLGLIGGVALAFLFRRKIKAGAVTVLEKAQPFVRKGYSKTEDLFKKAAETAEPLAKKCAKFVKDTVLNPVIKYVKG